VIDSVADKLQKSLNEKFSELKIPDYVAPITISDLSFGFKPPIVQLLDITPIPDSTKSKMFACSHDCDRVLTRVVCAATSKSTQTMTCK
jgi:hypothetical protein